MNNKTTLNHPEDFHREDEEDSIDFICFHCNGKIGVKGDAFRDLTDSVRAVNSLKKFHLRNMAPRMKEMEKETVVESGLNYLRALQLMTY